MIIMVRIAGPGHELKNMEMRGSSHQTHISGSMPGVIWREDALRAFTPGMTRRGV
jgi:hypothetical protein